MMASRNPGEEQPLLKSKTKAADAVVLTEVVNRNSNDDDDDYDEGQTTSPSWLGLLFFRSLYFLSGLSSSTWGRFGVIYYNEVKQFSASQIGMLQSIFPICGFIVQPFFGFVSDYIQSRKRVFVFNKVVSTAFLLSLPFVGNNFSHVFRSVLGMAIFRSAAVLDAHTIDFLGDVHRGLYGTIRVWAAISWGIGAVVMGHLTDWYGFTINFWLYGTMSMIMLLAVTIGLPARSKSEQEMYDRANHPSSAEGGEQHKPQLKTLKEAFLRLPILWWFFEVAVIGGGISIVESFLFVYLQNDLQASTVLCGYSVGVTVLFEIPIFTAGKYLLARVGHDRLFLLALASYSFRVLGYSMLTPATSHYVLPLEAFHGITFACAWIASVDFSAAVSPREWKTTGQSILSTVFHSVGKSCGPLFGGWLIQRYGFVLLWRGAGALVSFVAMIHLLLWFWGIGHDAFLQRIKEERKASNPVKEKDEENPSS